jgi:hypothetical protein
MSFAGTSLGGVLLSIAVFTTVLIGTYTLVS